MRIERIFNIGSYCYFGSKAYFREIVTSLIESAERISEQKIRDAANTIIPEYQLDINTPFVTRKSWDETPHCGLVFKQEKNCWSVGFYLEEDFHPITQIDPNIYAPYISEIHLLYYCEKSNTANFSVYFPVDEESKSELEERLNELIEYTKKCYGEISNYRYENGMLCVEFSDFQLNSK